MMSTLAKAIEIAATVRKTEPDKGGQPYILHPLRVMMRVEGEEEKMAAVLHDVVEDGEAEGYTLDYLRAEGFSERVLEAVKALTHIKMQEGTREEKEEDYYDYVRKAAENPIARKVKEADLLDNMDVTRLPELGADDLQRLAKYHSALRILRSLKSPNGS